MADMYDGIDCISDDDCQKLKSAHPSFEITCNRSTKKCRLPSLASVETAFLTCFIKEMSSFTEDYIRRNVLDESTINSPRYSPEFFSALREAAGSDDCVTPSDPLQTNYRTRKMFAGKASEPTFCGVPPRRGCEAVECPLTQECLHWSCKVPVSVSCPVGNVYDSNLFVAQKEECSAQREACNIDDIDMADCSDGYVCAFCSECDGEDCTSCVTVPAGNSEEICDSLILCESLDGSILITASEEECRAHEASCSVDCEGYSCRSQHWLAGVCHTGATDEYSCNSDGERLSTSVSWDNAGLCVVTAAQTESQCSQVGVKYMKSWSSLPFLSRYRL